MELNAPKKITLESEKRISKVLIIADTSSQALVPVLDSLQTLQKDHLQSVRIIFIPFLSETLKMNLGPNILGLLAREETETLAKAKEFFDRANIPCSVKVANDLLWKMVLDEIREGDQDLMILQGEVLTKWREHTMMGCPYRQMINSSECLVLTIE
jgi:hypothetical protein